MESTANIWRRGESPGEVPDRYDALFRKLSRIVVIFLPHAGVIASMAVKAVDPFSQSEKPA